MNRFRAKRKGKDEEGDTGGRFMGFRRGKKTQDEEEPKPEVDLATFLPSEDNFRTSLLMNNLSARFSMLREQDDPNTKIGKASDDSVLFPKRQSRFADLGDPGSGSRDLGDIAEVESIKGTGFSQTDADPSDDADSTTGRSIMNRRKPIDGNNLFGGRQKIYKISARTTRSGKSMSRALYEDDVAQSAFQRWKLEEKKRKSLEREKESLKYLAGGQDEDDDISRRDSPPLMDYNSKRETSSTTSSLFGMARNSTAATSINSQPTAFIKDVQFSSTAPSAVTSTSSTPPLDRSATRGRRLYEQHLAQDMHEQQASAWTRVDTLTRQKPLGARSPETGGASPSPTALGFIERWASERRSILTKGSAPNMRSMSPPASASFTLSPLDTTMKLATNERSGLGASPPLSPPVSDVGDHPLLPIRPSDHGKATAMGVFQKPSQGYDDSKFAQRQLQLQQGRETPSLGFRADSRASGGSDRPPSSSSSTNQQTIAQEGSSAQQEGSRPAIDGLVQPVENQSRTVVTVPSSLHRPSDMDHPAFRQNPSLSRLTTNFKVVTEAPSPVAGADKAADSPTLSPVSENQAGLGSMVRQHLRTASNTSSIYGGGPQSTPGSRIPSMFDNNINLIDELDKGANPLAGLDHEWKNSVSLSETGLGNQKSGIAPASGNATPSPSPLANSVSHSQEEMDEFASQLADARRRVREKLTSFVESDDGASVDNLKETSPNLKSKTSRGSLLDRSWGIVGGPSKAIKMLGLGLASPSTPNLPTSSRPSIDEPSAGLVAMAEEESVKRESAQLPRSQPSAQPQREPEPVEEDEHAAPGLRAFRQARRELQKRKELETLAKKQQDRTRDSSLAQKSPGSQTEGDQPSPKQSSPSAERPRLHLSRIERRPPVSQLPHYSHASMESLRGASESARNRSRSRSPSQTRPTHLTTDSGAANEQMPSSMRLRKPTVRSLGLPGTDIKRSPFMPPVAYPSPVSPVSPYMERSFSSGNLRPISSRPRYESSMARQRSPIPPMPGYGSVPPSPSTGADLGPSAVPPASFPSLRRSAASPGGFVAPMTNQSPVPTSTLNEIQKRFVDKRMISEPTFIMSTAKVPTVNLPPSRSNPDVRRASGSRSRSASNSSSGNNSMNGTPPLPPLNPRRGIRDQSHIMAFNDDSILAPPSAPFGRPSAVSLDLSDDNRSTFSVSDEDDDNKADGHRWRLQKLNTHTFSMNGRPTGLRTNARELINNINASISNNNGNGSLAMPKSGGAGSSYVARGPPVSRAVMTGDLKPSGSDNGLPGGMI